MACHLDQLNLVVKDMDRAIAFYRAVGMDIPDDAIWRTETGAHHVVMRMPDGFELALDSEALAVTYNAGWRDDATGSRTVMSFRLDDAAAVDATYERLVADGNPSAQPPYYTFWGSRYAIVADPDGNHVGLMSPPDPAHRGAPPRI
jgi:uncharacterized glyoxalase superfamily protein PhnB